MVPSFSSSSSTATITTPYMISQMVLNKPDFLVFYPQDQAQQFRFRVSFRQLLEVPPLNQSQVALDTLDLQALPWTFAQLENASSTVYGRYLRMQLTATANIQRGATEVPVDIRFTVFASERQNETSIFANDWVALESIGGPEQVKLDVSIRGWPFRSTQNLLVLRASLNGSQGTVRHHGEFSATELFNSISIINDVTQHQDASISWLQRAIVDDGIIRRSARVMLQTFADGEALGVDLYYPSFANATLRHDPLIATSGTFFSAPFVPIQATNLPIAGAVLLLLALSIIYLSRRSQYALRRSQ